MEQIIVYKKNTNLRSELRSSKNGIVFVNAECEENLMSSEAVRIVVQSESSIDFTVGDYIVVEGEVYRLNQAPQVVRDGRQIFEYTLTFESAKYDLANVQFLLPEETQGDHLTATLSELAQIIIGNANRIYPNQWQLGNCPDDTEVVTEQFTEKSCLAALQTLCELYGYEFRVTESNNVKTLDIFTQGANTTLNLEYGRGKGLYSITREETASEEIITRLYVYGSSENLPTGYPHTRLCLPYTGNDSNVNRRNASFIEDNDVVSRFGVKEGIVIFDDEKPHCKSTITQIYQSNRCKFKDTAINFDLAAFWAADDFTEFCQVRGYDPNDADVYQLFTNDIVGKERKYLIDSTATITFNTGNLAGYSFKLKPENIDAANHTFIIEEIILNEGDEILEQHIPDPNSAAFQFAVGDEYVISDINLPLAFVTAAETALQTRANEYYGEHSKVCARYSIDFDKIYLLKNHPNLHIRCGDFVHIKDTKLGINAWIKVTKFYRNLLTDEVRIEISDIRKRDPNAIYFEDINQHQYYRAIEDIWGHTYVNKATTLSCVFTPNHNATANTQNVNAISVSQGIFSNYTLENHRKEWRLYDRVKTDLLSRYKYNIYVKASKRTQDAEIYYEPVTWEGGGLIAFFQYFAALQSRDANYHYFQIGTLSKPTRRNINARYARVLTLEYGEAVLPANSIYGGDLIIPGETVDIINTATRAANFDTMTALYNGNRINVGNQAGRVTLIIDDQNKLIADRFADNLIIARMIASGAVTEGKINNGAVTRNKLANGAVNADKIAANSISLDRLATAVAEKINRSLLIERFINDGWRADRHYQGDISYSDKVLTLKDTKLFDSYSKARLGHAVSHWESSGEVTLDFSEEGGDKSFVIFAELKSDGSCEYVKVESSEAGADAYASMLEIGEVSAEDKNNERTFTPSIGQTYIENGVIKDGSDNAILDIKNGILRGQLKFAGLKDANNQDIDILSILGASPSTAGGLRKNFSDMQTTIGADDTAGLRKRIKDSEDAIGNDNAVGSLKYRAKQLEDNKADASDVWQKTQCYINPQTGAIIIGNNSATPTTIENTVSLQAFNTYKQQLAHTFHQIEKTFGCNNIIISDRDHLDQQTCTIDSDGLDYPGKTSVVEIDDSTRFADLQGLMQKI